MSAVQSLTASQRNRLVRLSDCVLKRRSRRVVLGLLLLIPVWQLALRPGIDVLAERRCQQIAAELETYRNEAWSKSHPRALSLERELVVWGLVSHCPSYDRIYLQVLGQCPELDITESLKWRMAIATPQTLANHGDYVDIQVHAAAREADNLVRRQKCRLAMTQVLSWFQRFEAETDADWQPDPEGESSYLFPPASMTSGYTINPVQWAIRLDFEWRQRDAILRVEKYRENRSAYKARGWLLSAVVTHLAPVIEVDAELRDILLTQVDQSRLSTTSQHLLREALLEGKLPPPVPQH